MLIAMIVSFLLSLVVLWNFLLANETHHEGWIVFFIILLFGSGVIMFLMLYKITDPEQFDLHVQSVLENEKTLLIDQNKNEQDVFESEESKDEKKIEGKAKELMTGIDSKSAAEFSDLLLRKISKKLDFVQGIIYVRNGKNKKFSPAGTFALPGKNPESFVSGNGIAGQATESKTMIRINDIPENYFDATSGLGNSKPKHLLFIPIVYKNQSIALIEVGSFKKPDETTEKILHNISKEAGKLLHNYLSN